MRSAEEGALPAVWQATAPAPDLPPLAEDLDADVCVVGAGIAGLTTAYHLARDGRRVVVLDDGPVGGGESGRTTAHLATSFDDYYHEAERLHGRDGARLLGESFRAGVDRIEEIVRAEGIACDFERLDGWWFAPNDEGAERLRAELEAARRAGFADVELRDDTPLAGVRPGVRARAALRFPRQAQFHILAYLRGLAAAVERLGGRVLGGAHVLEVHDGSPTAVRTDTGRTVRAADVVVATNTPVNDRVTMHTKQAPYRTYVIAARVARDAVPLGLYWDTLEPYHYVRLLHARDTAGAGAAHDLLLVGGEDHKTGQADDEPARFERLERWTRERFPIGAVEYRWSGQVMEPVDLVAFIGRNPGDRHVWIATGDSGNGMTHGTIAGMLLGDLIAGRANPWAALYDPSRISLRAAGTFARENLNVAAQYVDLVTPGEVDDVAEVPRGEGRVLRRGVHKVAAYRDADGAVTLRSAVCTHLGCVVGWNRAERTWDCPCHGSRFTPDGTVVNGPAVAPLPPADV